MEERDKNPFNQYSSKIKRINIPISEYSFYHKVSDEKNVDKKFIGREHITARLKNWLKDSHNYTGSYIITGYRGMGKSSFVGKVLNDISAVPSKSINVWYYTLLILGCLLCIPYVVPLEQDLKISNAIFISIICIALFLFVLCDKWFSFVYLTKEMCFILKSFKYYFHLNFKKCFCRFSGTDKCQATNSSENIAISFFSQIHFILKSIKSNFNKYRDDWESQGIANYIEHTSKGRNFNKLIIKINLGHEVLNERDILSLISQNIYDKFCKYLSDTQSHPRYSFLILLFTCLISVIIGFFVKMVWSIVVIEYISVMELDNLIIKIQNEIGFSVVYICLFILLFVLCYHFTNYIFCRYLGFHSCITSLQHLNDRIESTIHEDDGPNGVVATSILGINLDRKRKKSYPKADVRKIESDLVNILNQIGNLKILHPKFIVVFDELDKIDPDINYIRKTENESIPEFEQKSSGFPGGVTSRERKKNVLHLLANMKLFVSSANSKFIFIAGRELYDAFLADLSDREFAINSIFNGVIYVESFLTSDGSQKEITSMTESYISHQLIPSSFVKQKFYENYYKTGQVVKVNVCFKLYFEYLNDKYYGFKSKLKNSDISAQTGSERDLNRIESVMLMLYHFSVYLSHISNGSPKKISVYFEKYIKEFNQKESRINFEDTGNEFFVKGEYKSKYILSFGYVDQRKIGFIHYIAFPVVQSIVDNASQYGDKLLVSASFLVDHIYKHHTSGFSWRNLEHTPELLEVYRTPELRKFIASIISYMKQSHLSPIISGLYQLKFRKRIAEEISILSQFSEEISAIFNFTLDESLSVKKHYSSLLKHYQQDIGNTPSNIQIADILSGIHHILADLHLMDEEYTEAIFEYQNSIQYASEKNSGDIYDDKKSTLNILVQIRNILKLGLSYERRQTCNSAYQAYSQLVCMLVDYRCIDEKKLGLVYKQLETSNWKNCEAVLLFRDGDYVIPQHKEHEPELLKEIPNNVKISIKGNDLISELANHLTPLKSSIIMRLSLFEDIRLVYQALLAKLFVLEKIELGGITIENLKVLESEYIYLHLSTNEKDKFIISSDFFRKLAEIMYYKNGFMNQNTNTFFSGMFIWGYDVYADIAAYCSIEDKSQSNKYVLKEFIDSIKIKSLKYKKYVENSNNFKVFLDKEIDDFCVRWNKGNVEEIRSILKKFVNSSRFFKEEILLEKVQICNVHRQKMQEKGRYFPCFACKYYNRSLRLMMENYLNCFKDHKISKAIIFYNHLHSRGNLHSLRANYLSLLGHSLDGMGNVMLSCACKNDYITPHFLKCFLDNVIEREKNKNKELELKVPLSRLDKSILYYWDAAEAFKMSGNLKESSICLKKILSLLLSYFVTQEKKIHNLDKISVFLQDIKEVIVERCLRNIFSYYEYTNVAEIQRIKWLLTIQMYDRIPINYLSLFPDIEEILLIYYRLYIRCLPFIPKDKIDKGTMKKIYTSNFISSYRIENTVYERIMVLYYKAFLNCQVLSQLIKTSNLNVDYYRIDFFENLFSFLNYYLNNDNDLPSMLGSFKDCYGEVIERYKMECQGELNQEKFANKRNIETVSFQLKLSFIEYLINDTMFCLTKILETIGPSDHSTLFTNSFIAEVYQGLFEWNLFYESFFLMYKACDIDEEKSETMKYILDKLHRDLNNRYDASIAFETQVELSNKLDSQFMKCVSNIRQHLNNIDKNNLKDYASVFFSQILLNIDKSNIHRTINNYLGEMAIKKYRRAKEMHSEGKAYKEMINNMYFLDDDLSNDTCQFDFAIERYKINCGYIDNRIQQLKSVVKGKSIYKIDSYLGGANVKRDFLFDDLW